MDCMQHSSSEKRHPHSPRSIKLYAKSPINHFYDAIDRVAHALFIVRRMRVNVSASALAHGSPAHNQGDRDAISPHRWATHRGQTLSRFTLLRGILG